VVFCVCMNLIEAGAILETWNSEKEGEKGYFGFD
jgi:hypothetical protein